MHTNYTYIILNKIEDALKEKNIEEQEWGNPIGGDVYTKDDAEEEDVPNVSDDRPYKTYWTPNEQSELREQEDEEEVPPEEQTEEEVPEEGVPEDMGGEEMPPGEGGEMGPDMGMGMPEEEPKDPKELGRVYELKKIYARLVSIESYLSTSSDIEILTLRKYVSQAIEMFKTLAANVDSYKDRVDEIIIVFYKFLKGVYKVLEEYYSKESKENKSNKNNANLINIK